MNNLSCRGLDELFDYKNQIMEDLLTSETIVSLVSEQEITIEEAGTLMYHQLFPYESMPEVTEHATTYICCEVDVDGVYNKTFLRPSIYIWVFTHKSLIRLPDGGGIRTDKIASEIVELLNGSRNYGLGELNLESAKRFSPIVDYQGRLLKFVATDYNRFSPTGKPIPTNRKR